MKCKVDSLLVLVGWLKNVNDDDDDDDDGDNKGEYSMRDSD